MTQVKWKKNPFSGLVHGKIIDITFFQEIPENDGC
jgi:hypothetical protein